MHILKRTALMLLTSTMIFGCASCANGIIGFESGSDLGSDILNQGASSGDIANNGQNNNQNNNQNNGQNNDQNNDQNNNENNGSSSNKETVEHIEGTGAEQKNDLSRFSIIATKTNNTALNAATDLSVKLGKKGFSLSVNKSSVYEIIVGNNIASETKAAIAQLAKTDNDYIIQFSGTKIVIAAKNDLILSEACDIFLETYITPMTSSIITVKDGTTTMGISKDLTTIAYDETAQYEIVIGNVSSSVKTKVNELAAFMKTMCGITSIKAGATYSKTKNQILIGPAAFNETASATKSLQKNEYTVAKVDNKIIVSGKNDLSTIDAIDLFKKIISDAKGQNTKKGNYVISLKKAVVNSTCASLDAVPRFTGATYSATYPSGAGITQLYYTSADASKINSYVNELEYLGFKKTEDNSINGNRFVTCYGKNGLVHISYLNYNKTLTVILDSLKGAVYKESEPAYTKVTNTSLAVMTLDYDTTQDKIGSNYDASGMSYVITLEDGRYIVIDGGYGSAKDHHILFNYLKNNNKRKDGKIVIAAWVFTHDHSDHYGCFVDFSNTYGTRVTLEYYLMNCGDKSRYSQTPSGWLPGTSKDGGLPYYCLNVYFKNAKKIVPHTGQKITFCNTTFEVMCSQESHTPKKMELVNDSSIILRMNANGVKTLFLADAEAQTTNLLINMYGSTIKSDIMQIAHHGYSGGSTSLYQKVAPKWTLWPTSQECFNQRTTGGGNGTAQSQNRWARNNSTCYVGDDKIEILTFVGGTSKISVTTCEPNKNQG